MRRLVILACLVAIAIAGNAELVVDQYTGIYSSGNSGFKRYTKPEWEGIVDFGVYFWFKIDTKYPSHNWSILFTLSSNPDNLLRDAVTVGDRVLFGSLIGSQMASATGTPGNANAYHIYNYDPVKDGDRWAFYYQAYSGANKRLLTMIQFDSTFILDTIDNITHQPSDYYRLSYGQTFGWAYFPGTISKLVLQGGGNIYRESGWADLYNSYKPNFTPGQILNTGSSASEVVVDQYVGNYSSGNSGNKKYMKSNWNNEVDFGVYFWFKIDSRYPSPNWSILFTLTSNPDNLSRDAVTVGDRVLFGSLINSQMASATGTPGNANAYHIYNYDRVKDTDKWAFYYQAYSGVNKRLLTVIQFDSTYIIDKIDGITHFPSNYYKLTYGQTFGWAYFPGTISKLVLQGGGNIYRESNWDELKNKYNPSNPVVVTPVPDTKPCILIYTQENYQGTPINACGNINNLDIYTIRSIKVPQGYWIDLFDKANYAGKFTRVSQSYTKFPPLSSLVWQLKTSFSQKKLTKNSSKKNHKKYLV